MPSQTFLCKLDRKKCPSCIYERNEHPSFKNELHPIHTKFWLLTSRNYESIFPEPQDDLMTGRGDIPDKSNEKGAFDSTSTVGPCQRLTSFYHCNIHHAAP